MESYEILWKSALPRLEKTVTSIYYETFITAIQPVDIDGDKIILITPTKLIANTITEHVSNKIRDALRACNDEVVDFEIYHATNRQEYLDNYALEKTETTTPTNSLINPKFTFDSFVVGTTNEFIYAAAKAVAEQPGDAYNPLFIYGGTGLGKTHILMAIANYIKKYKPSTNVLYATCEQFTNQLIESISKGKAGSSADFRNRYRNVDVLLIDDVQFLSKKQSSQAEFFHTFNELVLQNKQIVLTSDRPPKEIEVLEERLRTRFEGGLLADVQPPDIETKTAILRRKAEEQRCIIDLKVLSYIAEMDDLDVRTLMGKLTKVIFFSKLHEKPITIDLVNEALKESASEKQEELQADDIINCVCDFYKIEKKDIISKKKNKEFTEPRQICMYLITEMMNLPLEKVGQTLGRDHATVIYARRKIAELIKSSNKMAVEINDIRKMILKQ